MVAMLFSLGYEGTGKTPEPEVARLMTSAEDNYQCYFRQTVFQPVSFRYSQVVKEVCRLLSIKQLTTTPYRSRCNGLRTVQRNSEDYVKADVC